MLFVNFPELDFGEPVSTRVMLPLADWAVARVGWIWSDFDRLVFLWGLELMGGPIDIVC